MSTHTYNGIKYYKIIINVAFNTFNEGDYQIQLVSKAMLAIFD